MASYRWGRIVNQMCGRCKKEATHEFIKKSWIRHKKRFYCDEHMLEVIKEERLE